MFQRCLLVKTLKPKILQNVKMEEVYYNTQSISSGEALRLNNFFTE